MKRILSLFLVLILTLGLCACNKPADEPTLNPTEPITTEPESPTEEIRPSEDETEDKAKEKAEALKEILANKSYLMNTDAVRATLVTESYSAQLAAIQNENKFLYSVSGIIDGVIVEYAMCQDDQENIYFYEELTSDTKVKRWYKCADTTGFDITHNLFDMSFFVEALEKVNNVEYIETDGNEDHFVVYSDKTAEHLEEPDAQVVFDIFITKLNEITSIRYYADDVEWIIMFISPDQAKLYIPEGTELGEISINEAQKTISNAHVAVQTPPALSEEESGHEEDINHFHETEPEEDVTNGYKDILQNGDYIVNWNNVKINFNNWMMIEKYSDKNGSFVESISAPINNPSHITTIKKVGNTFYYGETTNAPSYTWKEIDTSNIKSDIQDYGYYAFAKDVFQSYLEQIIDEMTSIEYLGTENKEDVVQIDIDVSKIAVLLHIQPQNKKITYISFTMGDFLYEISLLDSPACDFITENTSAKIAPNDCLQAQTDFLIKIAEIVGVTQEDLLSIAYGVEE